MLKINKNSHFLVFAFAMQTFSAKAFYLRRSRDDRYENKLYSYLTLSVVCEGKMFGIIDETHSIDPYFPPISAFLGR